MSSPCRNKVSLPSRRRSSKVRGFTLVEVVVALAILSLIMLATISALRTFANTQVSVDKMTTRVDEVRSVSAFLRDTLEAAVVASQASGSLSVGAVSGSRVPAYFKGDASSMEWHAPILFGESYGGVFVVRVAPEEGQLVLRWQEIGEKRGKEGIDWSDTPRRTLLESLDSWDIFYRPEFDLPWQDTWQEKGSPALVRIAVSAGGRHWPDLILRVQR